MLALSRCVILSACPAAPKLAGLLRPDDYIIACDAGYANCARLGCRPNVVVGDFDSAPCPVRQEGDGLIVLPHVKDDTDTEYAAKLACEKGFNEALLLGVLGGRRMEHTLANLCTGLGLEKRGVRTTLVDERTRITYVMPGETRCYPKGSYFYVSVFPMEGRAEGVTLRGSFYELTDAALTVDYPLGVSNEYAAGSDWITISVQKGILLVVETLPD
ncbi:MAG: thiamine diphosphokinase [Faecalibacterium sp.]